MSSNRSILALGGFALVALFGIWARPLLPIDETRYLAVAWEMRLTGNWLVPHLNGLTYTEKPPLLFWIIDLIWAVFGVSEISARLVGPAFGLASIFAAGVLARRLWPDDTPIGGRASLVLASLGAFVAYGGLTLFDTMLTLAVVLGVMALHGARRSPRGWLGFGCALALGTFAKGPVVLVYLIPAALSMPLWAGISMRILLPRLGLALLLGLAIVCLWLVPAMVTGGSEYRTAVLWTQSAGRVANSFAHARPWWFYLALIPLLLWPWVWSVDLWQRLIGLPLLEDNALRLCLIWALTALLLFSLISGKQAHYLIPALPAMAILFARAGATGATVSAWPAALLPMIVGGFFVALALDFDPGGTVAAMVQPAAAVALSGLALCVAFAALRLRGVAVALLGFGLVAVLNLALRLSAAGAMYDARSIASLIAPHDAAGIGLLGQDYAGEFTFAARLRNPIKMFDGVQASMDWLANTPGVAVIARTDQPHPATQPLAVIQFNEHDYGIWTSDY